VPLPRGLPIVDHHCHLSPAGEAIGAVRRFEAAGGTHLFLATQNYSADVPRSVEDYRRQFEVTEELARRIRTETRVVAFLVVAPYPVDLVHGAPALGLGPAVDLQRAALDLAGTWVREHRAVALGEVGRAHFAIDPDLGTAVDRVFEHALGVARDVGCPVVVHSEDLDAAGFARLAELARRVGLRPERIVKHYARERVPTPDRRGVAASYLARRELVRSTLPDDGPWFLETDFLDDPRRPGAVLDLATVPRRATAISESSPELVDRLWVPFVDSIERVYGLELGARTGSGG
jgi:TatD-related deoxyribonuclease